MRSNYLVRSLATVLGVLTAMAPVHSSQADWIQTMDSGVYQESSGRVKVILAAKQDTKGIFILSGPPVPVQLFNVEQTRLENTNHLFIRFDDTAQPPVYSEIVVNERTYKISGNLTINLDAHTSIGIDNNNPYLTIVSDHDGSKQSLLGFSGLNEVVRWSGTAATILAANQLNPEVSKVIRPYTLKGNDIVVGDQPIGSARLGVFIRPENECLKPDTTVLNQTQLTAIRQTKTEVERAKLLEGFLKETKKSSPLKGYLVLKAETNQAILLGIADQNLASVSPISSGQANRKVCVLAPLPLS